MKLSTCPKCGEPGTVDRDVRDFECRVTFFFWCLPCDWSWDVVAEGEERINEGVRD